MLVRDGFPERGLDLLGDIKVVEDGKLSGVLFHDAHTLRGNQRHIVFHFVENIRVVDVDVFIRRVEQVPQHGYGPAGLLIRQFRQFGSLLSPDKSLFTPFEQHFEFGVQFGDPLSFGHRPHDNPEVFGLDALDELLQSCPLFAGFDFGGNRHLVLERHQHQETSGKRQFACEARPFRGNRFFDDLHQDFLSLLEDVLHAPVFFQVRLDAGFRNGQELFLVADYLPEVFVISVMET